MTHLARGAVAAITLALFGCGVYAPPIRPDAPDATRAESADAATDDAMAPLEDAPSEDSDD